MVIARGPPSDSRPPSPLGYGVWRRAGGVFAFAAVCVLSGLAFGADLALPASMLADVTDHDEQTGTVRPGGAYFGLWHLLEKLALAIVAGIALPLLDVLGYQPSGAGNLTRTGAW